jgi:hypothetical protein
VSNAATIRAWANANNVPVNPRGLPSTKVREAWEAAGAPGRTDTPESDRPTRSRNAPDTAPVDANYLAGRVTNLLLAIKQASALLGMYEHGNDTEHLDEARRILDESVGRKPAGYVAPPVQVSLPTPTPAPAPAPAPEPVAVVNNVTAPVTTELLDELRATIAHERSQVAHLFEMLARAVTPVAPQPVTWPSIPTFTPPAPGPYRVGDLPPFTSAHGPITTTTNADGTAA